MSALFVSILVSGASLSLLTSKVTYVVAPSKENQINEDSKGNVVIGNGTLSLNS